MRYSTIVSAASPNPLLALMLQWLRVLSEVCLRLLLGHRSLYSQILGLLNDGSFRCVVAGCSGGDHSAARDLATWTTVALDAL